MTGNGYFSNDYSIEMVNEKPNPFRWRKSTDDILVSIWRFCLVTVSPVPACSITRDSGASGRAGKLAVCANFASQRG